MASSSILFGGRFLWTYRHYIGTFRSQKSDAELEHLEEISLFNLIFIMLLWETIIEVLSILFFFQTDESC